MSDFFKDESKLKLYSRIQKKLCLLKANSSDDEINEIFQIIPPTFFDEKSNLIMLCQFFGMIGRYRRQMGRISIKLFEKIMKYIKRDLQNESSLLWNIFGACSYFKYWMYKEGLIDINYIIISSQADKTSLTTEYFLPEIIEHYPELFHKEIKFRFPCFSSEDSYSTEKIEELRNLRDKHLRWLKESGDYHDESYKEIEKDPIRLAIKTDDISTFQTLLSRSNLSIDSCVSESMIEHFLRIQIDMHYIDYAANYCAYKIFNFLLLNGAKMEPSMMNFVIHSDNYDMIHIVESKMNDVFRQYAMSISIIGWNFDFIKYVIENYGYEFLLETEEEEEENEDDSENNETQENKENYENNETQENKENYENNETQENKEKYENKEDNENNKKQENDENNENNETQENKENYENKEDNENNKKQENDENNENDESKANLVNNIDKTKRDVECSESIVEKIFDDSVYCYNVRFFRSILLPFLRRNPKILNNIFDTMISSSFKDLSFSITDELIRYGTIMNNNTFKEHINTFLIVAINNNNLKAIEKFANFPTVDHNELVFYSCVNFVDVKILEILCHQPDFDINFKHPLFRIGFIQVSMIKGNVFALNYLLEEFPDIELNDLHDEAFYSIRSNHLLALKIFLKFLIRKNEKEKFEQIIDNYKRWFTQTGVDDSYENKLYQIIDEIKEEK